ncbi:MAG TPA: hypothetical protein VI197_25980 [Polyangiaceae bacterium]
MESEGSRLERVLLALPELELRVNWLNDQFAGSSIGAIAERLDELCARSEASEPGAREAMLAVVCCVVAQAESPLVRELRAYADTACLLSLARLLLTDRHDRGERSTRHASLAPQVVADVPDYGAGRELTVGERRTLARRPSRGNIERLLADPHPLVIRELLLNTKLTEDDVLRLAARRPAHVIALEALTRSTAWLCRPRVRFAMVQNPGTPLWIAGPLLVLCNRKELSEVVSNTSVSLALRSTAQELLALRPPLRQGGTDPDRALQ